MSRKRARRAGWATGPDGFTQAERCAFLDVIDPGGHKLLRFGRYLDQERDAGLIDGSIPREPFYTDCREDVLYICQDSIGEYRLGQVPKDGERLLAIRFTCKTCRDRDAVAESRVDYVDLCAQLEVLLTECRNTNTPRACRVLSAALP